MRKAAVVLAVVAALGALAALLAWHSLDLVVRVALERWGPDVTGVKVDVDGVNLSAVNGSGRIAGLELGSPPGFSAPRTARFGELRVALDPATLVSGVVVIRELAFESLQVTYERGDKGSNLDAIQRSIETYVKGSEARDGRGKGEGGSGAKRRFVIERFSIRKARVLMTTRGLKGQGLAFDLPDIDLRDVGKRTGGVTASQAAAIVASTLQQKIALRVLTNVEALRRGGLEGAIDALRGLVK